MKNITHARAFVLSSLALSFSQSHSATFFTEDFSSNTAGSNLQVTSGPGVANFSGGNAAFPNAGDGGRAYVGTNDSDYTSTGFLAEVTVTVPTGNSGADIAFFGLGSGIAGDTFNSSFNEPSKGPAIYVGHNPSDRGSGVIVNGDFNAGNNDGTAANVAGTSLGSGTHRLRMEYSATADTVTFSADNGNDGSGFDTYRIVVDASDNGFDASNARIFFGGANGVTFDDVLVTVPEPSSLLLAGMGFCGLLIRRRRH